MNKSEKTANKEFSEAVEKSCRSITRSLAALEKATKAMIALGEAQKKENGEYCDIEWLAESVGDFKQAYLLLNSSLVCVKKIRCASRINIILYEEGELKK